MTREEYLAINSLAVKCPDLLPEWDYEKNGELRPDMIGFRSNKKIWWKCSKGHSWQQTPDKRFSGQNCPYCSGHKVLAGFNDLATTYPTMAAEWNYEKNEGLRPTEITAGSNKKVWWKCNDCGHSWFVSPNARKSGTRSCPECAKKQRAISYSKGRLKIGINDLESQSPELVSEWAFDLNPDKNPADYNIHSREKVWWRCKRCGNEWQATIQNRVNRHSGCPKCLKHARTSFPEQAIAFYLKQVYPTLINSYTDLKKDSLMELDIYIPDLKIGIEYDGIAWHNSNAAQKRDHEKYLVCKENGISLFRVSEFLREGSIECDKILIRQSLTDDGLSIVINQLLEQMNVSGLNVDVERDRPQIMQQYITYLDKKSIAYNYPSEVKYWDIEKNKGLKAEMVNATSNTSYWWKCDLGHSYKAAPCNRLGTGNGCPYCSGHKVLAGFNDLQTKNPSLAEEWNYEKNEPLKPTEVTSTSSKKVWWKCDKGHEWQATVGSRSSGAGCPYCSGKRVLAGFNDLQSKNPLLAEQWNAEKNGTLKPSEVTASSGKKVWWKCDKGHEWQATVGSRSSGAGCPYCANQRFKTGINDLQTLYPQLASEWNYEKNKKTPSEVIGGGEQKVWWRCEKDHEWQAKISSRIRGRSCPYCSNKKLLVGYNDFATVYPEAVKEWDYDKNGDLKPNEISCGSMTKVWWKCPTCGYEFYSSPNSRRKKDGTLSKCYNCTVKNKGKPSKK